MGRQIAVHDWSRTSLGNIKDWPAGLRNIVDLMIASRQPAYIAWGPELVSLYNDSYIPLLGTKHPDGLGKPYAELFAEVWDEYAPVVAATMAGEAQYYVDRPVALAGRSGRPMSWFTFSWTPLRDEAGEVRGFYCAATETTERVQAARSLREARDEALRRSEERRDAALAAARLGTFEWDLTTNTVVLDARSREIFGFAPGEGTEAGQVFDRIHPDDLARVRAEAQSSENSLSRLVTEYRIQLPEGPVRTVASLSDAVIGPDGRAERMVGVFADVSERVQAEAELNRRRMAADRQRRLYEAILTNTPDLAYVWDLNHRFIYANEGLLRMWGRTWEEAVGRNCLELGYEPWHAAMHDREIEQVIATRAPVRGQVPFAGTFGRRIYDYLLVPVIGEDGAVEAVAGTTRDVTEQTGTEAALRESEAQLEAAMRAARMAAWRWSPREDRVTFSNTVAEVFGLPAGKAFASSAEALGVLHPDDAGRHSSLLQEARERGTTWHTEFRIIRPCDGKVAWLEERAASERDDATGEPQMSGLVWDITERKMAEEQQALLAREVDHRAKNALAVVQAALRLTKASSLPEYIAVMEGRVSALARAQTLLARDRWSGADLRTLLDGELAPFLGSRQRALLDGPAVMLPAHTAQPLAMTLHELATNAVKYGALSSEAGHVSVTWTVEGMPSGVMLRLGWTEAGGPPLSSPPRRMGFGSRVLEGTIRGQLGGSVSLEWESAGLVCTIGIPLQRDAAHQDGAGE